MDARTDYPWLTAFASRPSGGDPVLIARRREATAALDEIDRLRAEVESLRAISGRAGIS